MIISAAMKIVHDDLPYGELVVPCLRHGDGYYIIATLGEHKYGAKYVIEGFIDNKNNFLDREEAYKHALDCGQLSATTREWKRSKGEYELYSEDLY